MNDASLAQNYAQNQSKSSWIDDPFDLKGLSGFKMGVAKVTHQRTLAHYANDLVAFYAHYSNECYTLTVDDLPDDCKNELVRLYIEATGREVNECVYGEDFSINSDFTSSLLLMLKHDCQATRERFAKTTRRNLLAYYKKDLDGILNVACDFFHHSINDENGYSACIDSEHGDIILRKF